jgi:predicted branched-subunit amino acid permease
VAAGFSVLQSCLLSLLTFTGGSQFAAVGVVAGGGGAASAVAAASLLGIRNGLYGLRMAPVLHVSGWRRVAAAQITIDESTAVSISQEPLGEDAMRAGFWITGIGVFTFWNLFTFAGAVAAHALKNPAAWGLDAAVPAAFLGLLWPRLDSRRAQVVAAASFALALALTPVVPAGLPIVATAFIAIAGGWRS